MLADLLQISHVAHEAHGRAVCAEDWHARGAGTDYAQPRLRHLLQHQQLGLGSQERGTHTIGPVGQRSAEQHRATRGRQREHRRRCAGQAVRLPWLARC